MGWERKHDKIVGMQTREEKLRGIEREKARADRWIWGLHLLAVLILGMALFPMIFFFYGVWKFMSAYPVGVKILALSFSVSVGFFLFGLTLIFLCIFFKNLFGFRVAPGFYPMYSKESVRWMGYNSLILIANSAFLDVFRLSPFQTLFYRLMGAKIGKDTRINTAGLADLSLLEIGDGVVVGGGVALICHAFERGFLRLEGVKL
ncbi:MAG: hypothetical protein HYZ52_04170, partial [Candidatus Omnitrophica bacterium]|nr:hypothetical protein [Candidatus Omnitrophota bacterium]